MSALPGEITKQILSAPPRIIRSTKYSLTAQGRSVPFSTRLPTGRSSLENASGWIRLPRPAAGTIPHMVRLLPARVPAGAHGRVPRLSEDHRRVGRMYAPQAYAPVLPLLRDGVRPRRDREHSPPHGYFVRPEFHRRA